MGYPTQSYLSDSDGGLATGNYEIASHYAREPEYFVLGKVFWTKHANNTDWLFIVVFNDEKSLFCVPIYKFGRQGVGALGYIKENYSIVYTCRDEPKRSKYEIPDANELPMLKSIRIKKRSSAEHLDKMSRVGYADVVTVPFWVAVSSYGSVQKDSIHRLLSHYQQVNSRLWSMPLYDQYDNPDSQLGYYQVPQPEPSRPGSYTSGVIDPPQPYSNGPQIPEYDSLVKSTAALSVSEHSKLRLMPIKIKAEEGKFVSFQILLDSGADGNIINEENLELLGVQNTNTGTRLQLLRYEGQAFITGCGGKLSPKYSIWLEWKHAQNGGEYHDLFHVVDTHVLDAPIIGLPTIEKLNIYVKAPAFAVHFLPKLSQQDKTVQNAAVAQSAQTVKAEQDQQTIDYMAARNRNKATKVASAWSDRIWHAGYQRYYCWRIDDKGENEFYWYPSQQA